MLDLLWYQYLLIALTFIWSGFVRSSLGFGGALLSLPILLLIYDDPLVFLPIIAVHLLFFSTITLLQSHRKSNSLETKNQPPSSTVDWEYLKYALAIMIVPKIIGVLGILTLPADMMSAIIFGFIFIYSISYILNKPFQSTSKKINNLFLIVGGYVSGTSLTAAPLVVTVFAQRVAKERLRDTLFALWFILVSIKMVAFIYAGVDLQLIHHLWLLPSALVGHVIGLRFHSYMLSANTSLFYRVLGAVLFVISLFGLVKTFVT